MKNLFVFNSYFCVQLFDSLSISFKAVTVSLGKKQRKLHILITVSQVTANKLFLIMA